MLWVRNMVGSVRQCWGHHSLVGMSCTIAAGACAWLPGGPGVAVVLPSSVAVLTGSVLERAHAWRCCFREHAPLLESELQALPSVKSPEFCLPEPQYKGQERS